MAQVVEEPNVKLIDELFNEVDDDGGGSLDVAELTAAMRKLQETARANEGELASVAERIAWREILARSHSFESHPRPTAAWPGERY